jgi:hypothetical protein
MAERLQQSVFDIVFIEVWTLVSGIRAEIEIEIVMLQNMPEVLRLYNQVIFTVLVVVSGPHGTFINGAQLLGYHSLHSNQLISSVSMDR